MPNLFSLPIFFIVFRETLEAVIIVSVLLGLAKKVADQDGSPAASTNTETQGTGGVVSSEDDALQRKRLLRRMRLQILFGSLAGFVTALAIGGAFIAVWVKQASNLWAKSEELWEGTFQLIAALMIFVIGITMLNLDRAKIKWRIKLTRAFSEKDAKGSRAEKWLLFILPFVTVLREGLEGVIFVGGVSLGEPASSIPIATIVGIVVGLVVGFLIYQFASRSTLSVFVVVMSNFLLLIGAGLFAKAIAAFQRHAFNLLLGADLDDAGGDGPGSYDVRGNVWHLACCNPENKADPPGWGVFWSVFGWSNNADVGTVLGYVFYWIAVIVALVVMKFREGRTKLFGFESAAGKKRRLHREANESNTNTTSKESAGGDA